MSSLMSPDSFDSSTTFGFVLTGRDGGLVLVGLEAIKLFAVLTGLDWSGAGGVALFGGGGTGLWTFAGGSGVGSRKTICSGCLTSNVKYLDI